MSRRRTNRKSDTRSLLNRAKLARGLQALTQQYRGDLKARQQQLRDFVPSSDGQAEVWYRQITDRIEEATHHFQACKAWLAQAMNLNHWNWARFLAKTAGQLWTIIRDLQMVRGHLKQSIQKRKWPIGKLAA